MSHISSQTEHISCFADATGCHQAPGRVLRLSCCRAATNRLQLHVANLDSKLETSVDSTSGVGISGVGSVAASSIEGSTDGSLRQVWTVTNYFRLPRGVPVCIHSVAGTYHTLFFMQASIQDCHPWSLFPCFLCKHIPHDFLMTNWLEQCFGTQTRCQTPWGSYVIKPSAGSSGVQAIDSFCANVCTRSEIDQSKWKVIQSCTKILELRGPCRFVYAFPNNLCAKNFVPNTSKLALNLRLKYEKPVSG